MASFSRKLIIWKIFCCSGRHLFLRALFTNELLTFFELLALSFYTSYWNKITETWNETLRCWSQLVAFLSQFQSNGVSAAVGVTISFNLSCWEIFSLTMTLIKEESLTYKWARNDLWKLASTKEFDVWKKNFFSIPGPFLTDLCSLNHPKSTVPHFLPARQFL